ncbi:hypothetical protein SAMN02910358_01974 [Lachnospiraceae bacterium XBB1006]|nr:hypothetical protein SAMN02910358_01974 [Lachnospiraceae bacterium XBB1006]
MFRELCTKDNIIKQIAEEGFFSITYRADDEMGIRYVNFKAESNNRQIIIGVNSVDKQVKLQQAFKFLKEERTIFSRIAALSEDFFAIYTVNLEDDSYTVYKTVMGERFIGENEGGDEFKEDIRQALEKLIEESKMNNKIQIAIGLWKKLFESAMS